MTTRLDADSPLSAALELHPDVLDYILGLSPYAFGRLRKPATKRMLAPRLSLSRVSQMAGIPLLELILAIYTIAGEQLTLDERQQLRARLNRRNGEPAPSMALD